MMRMSTMRGFGIVAMVLWLSGCNAGETGDRVAQPQDTMAIGEDIYNKFCFSCHAAGVAGAPMVGDKDAWSMRSAKGSDLLLLSTIEGMPPGMPPMGLCAACTEQDLAAAIEYMLAASQ